MGVIKDLSSSRSDIEEPEIESIDRSDAFERLVVSMLPGEDFTLVQASARRHDLIGHKVERAKDPDFQFKHRGSGLSFWLECTYRAEGYGDRVVWATAEQLEHFRGFQDTIRPEKVYIIIGLGGSAKSPEHIFCLPLDEAEQIALSIALLERFEHFKEKPFKHLDGRLR